MKKISRIEEDILLRNLLQQSPSKFDRDGEMPLVWDSKGRPLTKEEILETVDSDCPKSE